MPWTNTHCLGTIRNAGAFTIGVEFHETLTEHLVKAISEQEPNQVRRFKPKSPWKYNRIRPISEL